MGLLLTLFGPGAAGAAMYWLSGKCRGKNAKNFFRYAAWGFWLLYLVWLPMPWEVIPIVGTLLNVLKLVPAGICFLMAINSILKEMRAQKDGEYTEAA